MAAKFIWLEFLAFTTAVRLDRNLFESYDQQLREKHQNQTNLMQLMQNPLILILIFATAS